MVDIFDPNVTQRVIAKTKKEWKIYAYALNFMHKGLPVYYMYLVGFSLTLQSAVPELSDYIPDKWRRIVLGVATAIVFVDKLRRSKPPADS
jgi:hypothetical protein